MSQGGGRDTMEKSEALDAIWAPPLISLLNQTNFFVVFHSTIM